MDARRAIVRLGDFARDRVAPEASRLVSAGLGKLHDAREGLEAVREDWEQRIGGPDLEERLAMLRERYDSLGGDPFGFDPELARSAALTCAFFHRVYFRTQVQGVKHVPAGPAILVGNHSGQIPTDGVMIVISLFLEASPPRFARAMIDKWTQQLPILSTLFQRVGQVVGNRDAARQLLDMGELLLVFPEGVRGISKPFHRRYQLETFRSGFMRLAMERDVPVVPVSVVGAEEQYVNVGNLDWAARTFGLPAFPVLPQVLLPGGQLPLPTRYRIAFGEPMFFEGDPDDDARVRDNAWLVRQTVQQMVDEALRARRSVFF